ncbi:hypothetical protein JOQ06_001169 [Pogonophryne albipinna]|uniref:Uncharacterized protein n=1 Tax=Pogonophryne albipinna TaxID=1090488 RepID=A0AAD6FK95_9TELE|nr:hypothetical protein JOQ06_001169 [Pogonophryne albipinna]
MKMAAPGLSFQAYLRMLDQRTLRFGRTGKISTDSFIKSFFESEEQAIFDGVFIARDEDVSRFVDYIHTTTKHVSGRGVCGGQWSAARETSQKSASKLDEEGLELACFMPKRMTSNVKTYRHADADGHVLESAKSQYLKTTKALEKQLQNLESMKAELAVTEKQLEDWVRDVNEWAETTTNNPRDAAALASKIEMLVSVKRRSQRLYKDTDSNKGRSRIRRKIRDEKGVLTATVEKYNSMVPSTEALCLEAILSVEKAWPWQLPNSDSFDLKTKRRAFDCNIWSALISTFLGKFKLYQYYSYDIYRRP